MEALENLFGELSSLFGCKYDDSFFDYLKSISVPNNSICTKEIKVGEGSWKCEDCEFKNTIVYCNDCFIKDKHIGHKAYFDASGCGFCDCGIKSAMKAEGFCDKHKGEIDNMKDLIDFIKLSINDKIYKNINDIFDKIIMIFIEKNKEFVDKHKEEVIEEQNELYKMFDYLEIFLDKLYKSNLSLFYFFTLKFTENYPYETHHKCFNYDENTKLITFIEKDDDEKHICICPFMQVMIYMLMNRNSNQNTLTFFSYFIQTYKNKMITSLCFLNSFCELFFDDNLKSFRNMEFQLIYESLSILVCQEQNIKYLEYFFEDVFYICMYFCEKRLFENLKLIIRKLSKIIEDLPIRTTKDKLSSNKNIIKLILDTCYLIYYEPLFENKINYDELKDDRYIESLVNVEEYNISIIRTLAHLINYENKEIMDLIFLTQSNMIYKFKEFEDNNYDKLFSPNIIAIRSYSLFLNRYCFNYSIKNECDLYDSFNHFLEIYPEASELNKYLFKEIINQFCFIISNRYLFFKAFGKNMIFYYINYFEYFLDFMECDITLMKYFLNQKEIKEEFNIKNLVLLSDVSLINGFFYELINDNINFDKLEFKNDFQRNCAKFSNTILEFLYLIIRDNISNEKLAFRNTDFKEKINDELYDKLYQKEKEKIDNIVKNNIIHFILGKKNLVNRNECLTYLDIYYDGNHKDILDEILKNDCDKKVLKNNLILFSLKKEILNSCDIDYIISFINRKNAIEYMTNFQSTNFNINNIKYIEPLNIKKKFTKNIYQTFYNEKNIDALIKLYNLLYNHKEHEVYQIYIFTLTKILSFAHKLCFTTDILDEDFKNKLIEKLNNIEHKDFLKEKESNDNNNNKNNGLKENLKKKFGKKNEVLIEKIKSLSIKIAEENKNEQEECIYCRQSISNDMNNNQYFGNIHYYFSDFITDILNKKPENKRKKSRKFVTCNHKIHFKCFYEFIINNYGEEFACPLCKKLSNIILFDFSFLEKYNYNIIKGINFTNEEINMVSFYEKNKEEKIEELLLVNISSFENYCSKLFHKQILIKDLNEDKNLFEKWFELITKDFEEFTIYFCRTNNKQDQIIIWKNILYNIRLLFKYKILNISEKILKLIENITKINNSEIFEKLLMDYGFNDIINMFIMISFILFDSNKENIKQIKDIFNKHIFLYFIYIAFLKSENKNNINEFLSYNNSEFKKVLNLYNMKYKICFFLFNENLEDKNIIQDLSNLKTNNDLINMINSTNKNNYLSHINEQSLEIQEFKIINLPESGLEFLNGAIGNCFYCNKKNLNSYLCLFCGRKMCNSINCFVEDSSKKRKEYSIIYHSKKCCGGNGLFLNVSDAEIIYILKRRIIYSKIYIYLNDFGDILKEHHLTDEYKLKKNELKEGIKKYIDMIFRKKNKKLYFKETE